MKDDFSEFFSDPKFAHVGNCLHFKACMAHKKKIPAYCDPDKCELYIPADEETCFYSSSVVSDIFHLIQNDLNSGKLSPNNVYSSWMAYDTSYITTSLQELIDEQFDVRIIPDGFDPRDREDFLSSEPQWED